MGCSNFKLSEIRKIREKREIQNITGQKSAGRPCTASAMLCFLTVPMSLFVIFFLSDTPTKQHKVKQSHDDFLHVCVWR